MDKQIRNTAEIVCLAKRKSRKVREKADKTTSKFSIESEAVDFNSVTKETNISKSRLCKKHDIGQRVKSLRERQIISNVASEPRKSFRSEEVLVKTLRGRIMELKKENKKLQNQIQKLYEDLCNKE